MEAGGPTLPDSPIGRLVINSRNRFGNLREHMNTVIQIKTCHFPKVCAALIIALLAAGCTISQDPSRPAAPSPPSPIVVSYAVASQPIDAYTVLSADMLEMRRTISRHSAADKNRPTFEELVDRIGDEESKNLMSTADIAEGETLNWGNIVPVEAIRYTSGPHPEIVSFSVHYPDLDPRYKGSPDGECIDIFARGTSPAGETIFRPLAMGVISVDSKPKRGTKLGNNSRVLITVAIEPAAAFHVIDWLGARGADAIVQLSTCPCDDW